MTAKYFRIYGIPVALAVDKYVYIIYFNFVSLRVSVYVILQVKRIV